MATSTLTRGMVAPRFGTPRRRGTKTLGPTLAKVALALGVEFHDWQRYVGDTALELVDRPGSGLRRLAHRSAGCVVPRQGGKTQLAAARAWLQCLLPELDVRRLVGGRVAAQRVAWLAQDRASALRAWNEAVDQLLESELRGSVRRVRLQRGDESVVFANGSTLRVVTPSRTGPRGLALDLVVLDEALAHQAELLAALGPTLAARDSYAGSIGSQLFLASSAGDVSSTLLAQATELGRRAVLDGDAERAWFEWSADENDDVYDPVTWAAVIPTLDRVNGISTEFVALQSESLERETFAREFLSVPSSHAVDRPIDLAAWDRAPSGDTAGRIIFAVDADPRLEWATIVAAGQAIVKGSDRVPLGAGDVVGVEVVQSERGADWLPGRLGELAATWKAPVVVDQLGPLGWLVPALQRAHVRVVTARTNDVLDAAATFANLVAVGRLSHPRDPRLDVAVDGARRRRVRDRWCYDRHVGLDMGPLVAASLGAWGHVNKRGGTPRIH